MPQVQKNFIQIRVILNFAFIGFRMKESIKLVIDYSTSTSNPNFLFFIGLLFVQQLKYYFCIAIHVFNLCKLLQTIP